jgi:ribonuclease R
MVPLRALTNDYYLVKEDEYTVIGKRHGKRFRIGDAIRVKLSAVDVDRMFIDFEVVS